MTLDGFLTFLTLIIAAYAIVPTVTRLRLRLHIVWPLIISVIGFSLVIYFEFFSLLGQPCPKVLGTLCRVWITPESHVSPGQAAFATVIVWLLLAWAAFARTKLSPRALPILSKLVSELVYEWHQAELVKLLEPHVVLLDRAAKRQLKLARLHDRLWALDPSHLPVHKRIEQLEKGEAPFAERSFGHRALALVASKLAYLVPAERDAEEAANDIFRVILQTPGFTRFIAISRPKFGVQLLSCSVYGIHEFCAAYLTALIENNQSELYKQIKHNQNVSFNTGYALPAHNFLLHFLFSDATKAEHLGVWQPLGEYIMANLRPGSDPEYVRFLNGPADSFEDERWGDKTFVVIRFFDLMVNAAEHQGVRWHMWLYYFPHFLERIVAFYDASGPDINPTAEWPTRASYLIYQIFDALTGWVETVKALPPGSPHRVLMSDNPTHENGNIPKSAAIALGFCLKTLLTANGVSERFKGYIYDVVMRAMRNLNTHGFERPHRAILIKTIIQGGIHDPAQDYGEMLKRLWQATDHVVRADLNDYRTALFQAYP